ncbi:MAG: YcbK family protein [Steroidobacteraceae bacterium]
MSDRRPSALTRRRFLSASTATGALMATAAALPVLATTERRTLSFKHTHTGETLHADYFIDGIYQPDVLTAINHLLRDFRTGDVHAIDPELLDLLNDLSFLTGVEAPYQVISAYRSPATNAMLRSTSDGVAEHSQHMLGKAIDIRVAGVPTPSLGAMARTLARGGVGIYPESDFVHVDTGAVRNW